MSAVSGRGRGAFCRRGELLHRYRVIYPPRAGECPGGAGVQPCRLRDAALPGTRCCLAIAGKPPRRGDYSFG